MEAICLVNSDVEEFHIYGAIIADIRHMMQWNWDIHLGHVHREANAYGDHLAKKGKSGSFVVVVMQDPLASILPFISADAVGTLFSRVQFLFFS